MSGTSQWPMSDPKIAQSNKAPKIEVRCEAVNEDEVILSVADNGPGIMPEHLPHVFDRFWQATHQRRAGAGLGLAIAKNIIEAHKGRIWAESDPGKGSVFSFTLPRSG